MKLVAIIVLSFVVAFLISRSAHGDHPPRCTGQASSMNATVVHGIVVESKPHLTGTPKGCR